MPEHVHLLILPNKENYDISQILASLKIPVARHALSFIRSHAPESLNIMRDEQPNGKVSYRFWQRGGGYDRNLVKPETVHATIDYVHANPVRRGLVESPRDWYWSSAGYYVGNSRVPLMPDEHSIPACNRT